MLKLYEHPKMKPLNVQVAAHASVLPSIARRVRIESTTAFQNIGKNRRWIYDLCCPENLVLVFDPIRREGTYLCHDLRVRSRM